MKSRKKFQNTTLLFRDRVWGEWVQRPLWRLPKKAGYLKSSHFLEDGAIHIRKVRRNAFQRCYRLLRQYPRFKDRYIVQFTGDNRLMVQNRKAYDDRMERVIQHKDKLTWPAHMLAFITCVRNGTSVLVVTCPCKKSSYVPTFVSLQESGVFCL